MSVASDPVVGRVVAGRYRVLGRVAQGGMATVYRAEDTRLGRGVALKVMHPQLAASPDFVHRFRVEARAAAAVSHPSVVGVYDQGEDGPLVWLAMELLSGRSVRDLLRERGGLSPGEAFRVMEALLVALDEAHRRGLVHRDVKPENILLSGDGAYKVSDFGLARAGDEDTHATGGALLGTPQYLAPETARDGQVDARVDLYAAGIVLYELLTGRPPHTGEAALQVLWSHANSDVPAPSLVASYLPPSVDELVAQACSRDPRNRPDSAAGFLTRLQRVWSRLPSTVRDATPPRPSEATSPPGVPAGAPVPGPAPAPAPGPAADPPAAGDGPRLELGDTRVVAAAAGPPPGQTGRTTLALRRDQIGTRQRDRRAAEAAAGVAAGSAPPESRWATDGEPASQRARQRQRRGPSLAVVLLVLLTGSLGAGVTLWFLELGPAAYVTVPDVVDRDGDEAARTMELNGIRTVSEEAFSDDVPAGVVLSTEPAGGDRVHRDGTVTLVVSAGPQVIGMIDVVGNTPEEAGTRLTDTGLTTGAVTEAYDAATPEGRVASSSPAEGEDVERGTAVDLVVSLGPPPVVVPGLAGLDEDAAEAALADAGLDVGDVTTQNSDDVAAGVVLGQSPEPGTPLAEGDEVALVVSLGPELVEVPDVTDQPFRQARQQLEELGFEVERNGTGIFGRVILQDPDPGTEAPPGSTVTLTTV